jgi:hypothetical protein
MASLRVPRAETQRNGGLVEELFEFRMNKQERAKLLGKYRSPRFKYGDVVTCAIRGEVKIVGITNARIPWPKCRTGKRSRAIILYGGLADAVRTESAVAVAYWFGVGVDKVTNWRIALGVRRKTEGTSALMSRWAPETCQSKLANRKRMPTLKSPERNAKFGAAKRGKPMPPHVAAALLKANLGRKPTPAARKNMSEAQRRRGGWTQAKDRLLGTMPDAQLAARFGCAPSVVRHRRQWLRIPAHRDCR